MWIMLDSALESNIFLTCLDSRKNKIKAININEYKDDNWVY